MTKRLIAALILFLCQSTFSYAGPAAPDITDILQPDGTAIRTRTMGDEFQGWVETEETGHTIIRNKTSGYWEYAEQTRDGSLQGNGIRVLPNGMNAPAALKKRLKPPRNSAAEKQMQLMLQDTYQNRLNSTPLPTGGAEAAPGDWVPSPVSGARKLLVVMVGFADKALSTTPASWSTAVFDTAANSVAKYYQDNSFSTLSISPVSHTQPGKPAGVVSVTLASNHPNTAGSYTFTSDQTWGNSALQLAANYVNFNSLDTNGDGRLDTAEVVIYFIAAGYETSAGSGLTPSMWAHAWWTTGTGLTAGTKNVQRWALNGEYYNATTQMTMGVIAHELGHQMCGLPDLYDISQQNSAMGNFSLMAGGSWGRDTTQTSGATPTVLDAWSREFLGWATPVVPTASAGISLAHPLSSPAAVYKLVNPGISSTEYFLVENRQPTGWDLGLRGLSYFGSGWTGGLLITHIDNTAGTLGSNNINSYTVNSVTPGHQGVLPVQASTATGNMLSVPVTPQYFRGAPTTLFYAGNNASWGPLTAPNSNYYNGSATNFSLTSISAPAATMTASLSLVTVPGVPTAVSATSANGQAIVSFTPPAVNGSSAILDYTATSAPGGFTATGAASPLTVNGLTNGTPYTFTVTARNSAGSSAASAASNEVVPMTIPGVPALSYAAPGDAQALIAFSAPASDGGSAILDYTVTSSPGGFTATGTTSPLTVTGLSNGTAYTFTVTARNAVGYSAPSTASASIIPGMQIRIRGIDYQTIASAYAAIIDSDLLQLRETVFSEAVNFNSTKSFTLRGGYDATFTTNSAFSTISGSLTITSGSVTMENIAII